MDKNTMDNKETVTITKSEYDALTSKLDSLAGLADLVKNQNETIKTLKEEVANASSRIDNTAAAVSGKYITPAKVPGGKHEYLTIKGKVMYKQAATTGVITESEKAFEITMPKPCGHLNGIDSELAGRMIPRFLKSKGVTDYAIVSINYDEDKGITKEMKDVSFIGKKPFDFTEEECQDFAIIYEALSVPATGSLATMQNAVAQEWAYVMHDVKQNKQAVVNGRVINKKQQIVDLVQYVGVRQHYPDLTAMTPSKFREVAESAAEQAGAK